MRSIMRPRAAAGVWTKHGHVWLHPEDTFPHPAVVLHEDPNTWRPAQAPAGVSNWGIASAKSDVDDVMGGMLGDMLRMTNSASLQQLYTPFNASAADLHDTPTQQFCKVLERRKLKDIEASTIQTLLSMHFTVKVTLCEVEGAVWRRVIVPSRISLRNLHDQVLCPAMGWSRGYHGYVFEDRSDGTVLGPTKPGDGINKSTGHIDCMHAGRHFHHVMSDQKVPLALLLQKVDDTCTYVYDLGDYWKHHLTLEAISEQRGDQQPKLLGGQGACPGEDSGGLATFAELLQSCKSGQISRDRIREVEQCVNYRVPWDGRPPRRFKPFAFDLRYHQMLLERMVAGPNVRKLRGNLTAIPSTAAEQDHQQDSFKVTTNGCNFCGERLAALKRCPRCRVYYCGAECQRKDWDIGVNGVRHKRVCRPQAATM